jgi:hypothetical protein
VVALDDACSAILAGLDPEAAAAAGVTQVGATGADDAAPEGDTPVASAR